MKILVSGANGMLGLEVLQILEQSHQVLAVDVEEMDITDAKAVKRVVDTFSPQTILNVAAYTHVDRCESEESIALRVNADGPENLARAASDIKGRLIHISTDYVFDGHRKVPQPYFENDTPNPQSAYGRTKLSGERRVLAVSQDHVIVRTAWLYGCYGKNFLKTMLRLALENPQRQLSVVDDQFGCPTWSKTLALQLAALIQSPNVSGIYHAVGLDFCTWYELARHFLETMSVPHKIAPCPSQNYPTPANRPINAILENSRLKAAGISKMRKWQTDVEEFVVQNREILLKEIDPKLK